LRLRALLVYFQNKDDMIDLTRFIFPSLISPFLVTRLYDTHIYRHRTER
jgi:hypothetical protein